MGTKDVFQSPELTRNSPVITIRAFFQSGGRNDCEPVVRARFPAVAEALDWLGQFAPARLTGTGSCIFAPCATAIDAERIAARVPDRWTSYVARGLNTSPVHESRDCGRGLGLMRHVKRAGTTHNARVCALSCCWGVASGKAAGFDPAIRRFESFTPANALSA